ncbi:MAG: ABC transporter permease [Cyclobacteriaceae bacterium]|nr:ABC transporter permease [Cyclobacteriaceae bacterium]
MIKNILTVAWRNLLQNKLYSLINVIGLAIGVSACLVIYLIVTHELSFNRGFEGYDQIYRVHSVFKGVFSGLNRGVPAATGTAMKEQFTGIASIASFHGFSGTVVIPSLSEKNNLERQEGMILADPAFFDVFQNYEWIVGSPQLLEKPFQTILTESRAKRYFGTAAPEAVIGKEIIYRDSLPTTVAGIVKDLPFNTDIDFQDFISISTIEKSWLKNEIQIDDWSNVNSSSQLFIRLDEQTAIEKIQSQMPILSSLYKAKSDWDVDNDFKLQSLSDLHFNSESGIFDHSQSPAHLPTLGALLVVAILLLLIASINFINLETAQSFRRAREVGIRKVMGSSQTKLIAQFLTESLIITIFAVVFALPISEIALTFFNEFVPQGVEIRLFELIPFLISLIFIVSFLAGFYPAFALSSFLPAAVLKNRLSFGTKNSGSAFLRKSLIVFQFTFAQVLIIVTLIVGLQIRYLLSKDLGFKKDAIVYFNTPWHESHEKKIALKNELEKTTGISKISLSSQPPSYNGWSSSTISYKEADEIKVNAFRKFGDSNFLNFYGIKLLSGRNLSPSDTVKEVLINETLLKQLGFATPHDAIGQQIDYNKKTLPIVGVVSDFHIQSLHNKVEPVIIADESKNFTCFNIQLENTQVGSLPNALEKIETAWKKVYPNDKIHFEFLDETIKHFYKREQSTSKLARTAAMLAILISCLGLFGLATYTSAQRTKEIGIRKVLGATAQNIVLLLSRDFILLVLVAFLLAAPIAWIVGNMWLSKYPYQVEIKLWLFALTAVIAVVIALVTVGYQTLKVANDNPVNSLRNE